MFVMTLVVALVVVAVGIVAAVVWLEMRELA
jgi:hypothetical protein